MMNNEL